MDFFSCLGKNCALILFVAFDNCALILFVAFDKLQHIRDKISPGKKTRNRENIVSHSVFREITLLCLMVGGSNKQGGQHSGRKS